MPTKAEKMWMNAISEFPCCVCGAKPAVVHHILSDSHRRMGHLFTIPLCDPGHHQNASKDSGKISRHPWKKRFEEAYGKELELHAMVKALYENGAPA